MPHSSSTRMALTLVTMSKDRWEKPEDHYSVSGVPPSPISVRFALNPAAKTCQLSRKCDLLLPPSLMGILLIYSLRP
jgi:hypothetical protein